MEQAVAVQIQAPGHGNAGILLQQRKIGQQQRLLFPGRNIPHGAVRKGHDRVPVPLKTLHHGVFQNLRIRRGRIIKPVQSLLQMLQIRHRSIVPELSVINPQKCPPLHPGLHLLQDASLVGNARAAAILGSNIGIKAIAKLNHNRFSFNGSWSNGFYRDYTPPRMTGAMDSL